MIGKKVESGEETSKEAVVLFLYDSFRFDVPSMKMVKPSNDTITWSSFGDLINISNISFYPNLKYK